MIEPVQLQRELVERLSAFVIAAKDIHFPCFSQGVQFVDEDDAGGSTRCLGKEIAHTDARTPTNISTNADPLMLKKGTCASPATPFARRVLVVPARQQGELLRESSLTAFEIYRDSSKTRPPLRAVVWLHVKYFMRNLLSSCVYPPAEADSHIYIHIGQAFVNSGFFNLSISAW